MGDARKLHEIWIEQCEAAISIKQRYGLDAAFDYLVAEKLLNFSEAATQHPTFAKELPRFVAKVRSIFIRKELCSEIERLEREQRQREADAAADAEVDELLREKPEIVAARSLRFATLKALLTAPQLGISEQPVPNSRNVLPPSEPFSFAAQPSDPDRGRRPPRHGQARRARECRNLGRAHHSRDFAKR